MMIEALNSLGYTLTKPSAIKNFLDYKPQSKAGFFPDHLIGTAEGDAKEVYKKIKKIDEETLESFVGIIDGLVDGKKRNYLDGKQKKDVKSILDNYLLRNIITFNSDIENKIKIIQEVEKYLNSLEFNRSFIPGKCINTCKKCLKLPEVFQTDFITGDEDKDHNVCPLCFLKLNANKSSELKDIMDISPTQAFPSIEQILGLSDREIKDKRRIRRGYKYYLAVIKADGDNMGKKAEELNNPQKFSQMLFEFTKEVDKKVKSISGIEQGKKCEAIFIGGDEFLVFMPVAVKESNGGLYTVLDFVNNVKQDFQKCLPGCTISFGLNIAYYKYPLAFMLRDTEYQLDECAKKEKDSISIQLTQHSGQKISIKFSFNENSFSYFNELLKKSLLDSKSFPKAVHHKIISFKKVFENITVKDRLEAFWYNRYIKSSSKSELMMDVKQLLDSELGIKMDDKYVFYSDIGQNIINAASQIRFVKFLLGVEK
jgi:hypothetical protein